MTPFALALRTARRYRARAVLAVVGVAVIGALNFDMLMLSRGLILSFADLLAGSNYDIRISGSAGLPLARAPIDHAAPLAARVAALPEVASVATAVGAELSDVHISEPSLENLFLHHTGRSLRD